jgi:hypothetical protein
LSSAIAAEYERIACAYEIKCRAFAGSPVFVVLWSLRPIGSTRLDLLTYKGCPGPPFRSGGRVPGISCSHHERQTVRAYEYCKIVKPRKIPLVSMPSLSSSPLSKNVPSDKRIGYFPRMYPGTIN